MSESTRIPPRRKSKGDGQFMFSALILVLVVASLLGMYFYIEDQKNKSSEAVEVIAGKVQNIESKLSITNEDSAQNMDTVTDQISFLDKEVRKLFNAVDLEVSRLKRTRFGPIFLPSSLKRGQCIELSNKEIDSLKNYGT